MALGTGKGTTVPIFSGFLNPCVQSGALPFSHKAGGVQHSRRAQCMHATSLSSCEKIDRVWGGEVGRRGGNSSANVLEVGVRLLRCLRLSLV